MGPPDARLLFIADRGAVGQEALVVVGSLPRGGRQGFRGRPGAARGLKPSGQTAFAELVALARSDQLDLQVGFDRLGAFSCARKAAAQQAGKKGERAGRGE